MSLYEEARRIKRIATQRHPPGVHLIATFKQGGTTREVHYANPRDIAETIYDYKTHKRLFLYSVRGWIW